MVFLLFDEANILQLTSQGKCPPFLMHHVHLGFTGVHRSIKRTQRYVKCSLVPVDLQCYQLHTVYFANMMDRAFLMGGHINSPVLKGVSE